MRSLLLGLSCSCLLLHGSRLEAVVKNSKDPCEPCYAELFTPPDDELPDTCPAGYNASARIGKDPYGVFADASFIYWNVNEVYLDFGRSALYGTDLSTPSADANVAFHNPSYRPGFQVGVGYVSDYDNWCVGAAYTWINQTNSAKAGSIPQAVTVGQKIWVPNEWFVNISSDTQQQAVQLTSKWHASVQYLDVLLSRPYYQGYLLTVTPSAGLRALWIGQRMQVNAVLAPDLTGAPAVSVTTSQLWSIGPALGAELHWLLGKGVRIETSGALSLLYSRFGDLNHRESFNSTITGTQPISGHFPSHATINTTFETDLGLGWGTYTGRRNRSHFDLSATYHFAIFSQQNKPREVVGYFANNEAGYSNPIGDLFLQGLTVKVRLDF
jgi:hypothetical protein